MEQTRTNIKSEDIMNTLQEKATFNDGKITATKATKTAKVSIRF